MFVFAHSLSICLCSQWRAGRKGGGEDDDDDDGGGDDPTAAPRDYSLPVAVAAGLKLEKRGKRLGRCLFRRSRPITEMFSPHKTKHSLTHARTHGSPTGLGGGMAVVAGRGPPPPPSIGCHAEEGERGEEGGMSEAECSWRGREGGRELAFFSFSSFATVR